MMQFKDNLEAKMMRIDRETQERRSQSKYVMDNFGYRYQQLCEYMLENKIAEAKLLFSQMCHDGNQK